MTINDQELTEQMVKIHEHTKWLDYLTREGKSHRLFLALSEIEIAAREAQHRLNDITLKWPK